MEVPTERHKKNTNKCTAKTNEIKYIKKKQIQNLQGKVDMLCLDTIVTVGLVIVAFQVLLWLVNIVMYFWGPGVKICKKKADPGDGVGDGSSNVDGVETGDTVPQNARESMDYVLYREKKNFGWLVAMLTGPVPLVGLFSNIFYLAWNSTQCLSQGK